MTTKSIVRIRWSNLPVPADAGWQERDFEADGFHNTIPVSSEAEAFASLLAERGAKQLIIKHLPEADLSANTPASDNGEADLRSIHEHRHDKLKAKCPTCFQIVVKAFDPKLGTERMFDLVNKTGRFIIREGKADWWGPTGGEAEVHGCDPSVWKPPSGDDFSFSVGPVDDDPLGPRPVTADNVVGDVLDLPDWDELGYSTPRRRNGVGQ